MVRFVGPVIAAVLVDRFGEAICFTINAANYLAVISSPCCPIYVRLGLLDE